MKLFRLEDYEAKINKEEALLIPEFKALFKLKYNKGKGDVDGRKRIRGGKEITYIYFMKDYKSEHANFTNDERHSESLKDSELPANYKISKQLEAALEKYDKLQQTLSLKALSAVRNNLLTSMGMVDTLELLMQGELKLIKDDLLEVKEKVIDEDPELAHSQKEDKKIQGIKKMDSLLSLIEKSSKIANALPKTIKTLEDLKDKVKTEKQADGKVRGEQEGGWLS